MLMGLTASAMQYANLAAFSDVLTFQFAKAMVTVAAACC